MSIYNLSLLKRIINLIINHSLSFEIFHFRFVKNPIVNILFLYYEFVDLQVSIVVKFPEFLRIEYVIFYQVDHVFNFLIKFRRSSGKGARTTMGTLLTGCKKAYIEECKA